MSETAILGVVAAALWGVVLALLAVVWATLKERLNVSESKVGSLEGQNTEQETAIGRLTERMVARENAHSEHREAIDGRLSRIEDKLDRLLRPGTPFPSMGRYGHGSEGERK